MQPWDANSQSHVSCMRSGDFFANEKSVCVDTACDVKVELVKADEKFSLHMKATMMKISNPIIFGHCVTVRSAGRRRWSGSRRRSVGGV